MNRMQIYASSIKPPYFRRYGIETVHSFIENIVSVGLSSEIFSE